MVPHAVFLTVYIRYRQLLEIYGNHSSQSLVIRANKFSLGVGCVSALGMSLAANFQETNVLPVHLVGAIMAFGGSTLYLCLQVLCLHFKGYNFQAMVEESTICSLNSRAL